MENFDAKKFATTLKRKVRVGILIITLLCVAVTVSTLFADGPHPWRIIIALVLFFALRQAILVWYAKKLYALIDDDLAPERLLDVIREGKFYSHSAILELTAYLTAGCWQQVADICAQKLNDPTLATQKCNYMAYLADMYFSLGDDARLREIVDAFRAASYTPAKVVGLTDRGEIREGLRADLVFTDIKMNIKTVILNGEIVREN